MKKYSNNNSPKKSIVCEPAAEYGRIYTYADYLTMEVKERIEIIKGRIFKMSPGPRRMHQGVSRELNYILYTFFRGKSCKVYAAPFDIRLVDKKKQSRKDEDIITVFQPDLCVICDEDKLDDRGCIGAPDLVVEIVSSKSNIEKTRKYDLYEENGVREYWIVDYDAKTIYPYILQDDVFIGLKPKTEGEVMGCHIFPNLSFDVSGIFQD